MQDTCTYFFFETLVESHIISSKDGNRSDLAKPKFNRPKYRPYPNPTRRGTGFT